MFWCCELKHMPFRGGGQQIGPLPKRYPWWLASVCCGYLMSIWNWLINRCWKDITFYHCKNKQTILPGICTIYYVFRETCFWGMCAFRTYEKRNIVCFTLFCFRWRTGGLYGLGVDCDEVISNVFFWFLEFVWFHQLRAKILNRIWESIIELFIICVTDINSCQSASLYELFPPRFGEK